MSLIKKQHVKVEINVEDLMPVLRNYISRKYEVVPPSDCLVWFDNDMSSVVFEWEEKE